MPRYEVRPLRVIQMCGTEVTPEDVVATIETDLPPRDVLALVQFNNAALVDPDAETDDEADEEEGDEDAFEELVASLKPEAQASLKDENVGTAAQASVWLRDNGGTFVKLDGIGKAGSEKLIAAVKQAGFPTEASG